jgi:thioredoxin reductase (NADPH)
VHLVHRGAKFRAQQYLIDSVAKHSNIVPMWNSVAEEVIGAEMVNKVRVRNLTDAKVTDIPCTGFFAYIGLQPTADFVPAEVARDADGHVITDDKLRTSIPGLFAAGAVRAGYGGLLDHAMAEGTAAAKAACASSAG